MMIYSAVTIFSWSTFQFTLNLIAIRGRTFRIEPKPLQQVNYRIKRHVKNFVIVKFQGDMTIEH